MTRFIFLALFFTLPLMAQDSDKYRFRLEGSFRTSSLNSAESSVNFVLSWNERPKGIIQGHYTDGRFSTGASAAGSVNAFGRVFRVPLSGANNGPTILDISTPTQGEDNGMTLVTFTLRKENAVIVDTFSSAADMTSLDKEAVPADEGPRVACVVGMGALTDFCGDYSGTISRTDDKMNRCTDMATTVNRLELASGGIVRMNVKGAGTQDLGIFERTPLSQNVSISREECGDLPGTTFDKKHCKELTLSGKFSDVAGNRIFDGIYQIKDTKNGENCQFTMRVGRQDALM
jgi:hypothetical protein